MGNDCRVVGAVLGLLPPLHVFVDGRRRGPPGCRRGGARAGSRSPGGRGGLPHEGRGRRVVPSRLVGMGLCRALTRVLTPCCIVPRCEGVGSDSARAERAEQEMPLGGLPAVPCAVRFPRPSFVRLAPSRAPAAVGGARAGLLPSRPLSPARGLGSGRCRARARTEQGQARHRIESCREACLAWPQNSPRLCWRGSSSRPGGTAIREYSLTSSDGGSWSGEEGSSRHRMKDAVSPGWVQRGTQGGSTRFSRRASQSTPLNHRWPLGDPAPVGSVSAIANKIGRGLEGRTEVQPRKSRQLPGDASPASLRATLAIGDSHERSLRAREQPSPSLDAT